MPDENTHGRDVAAIFAALQQAGLVRSTNNAQQRGELAARIERKLIELQPRHGRFAACADVLLAMFNTADQDEPTRIFSEYFSFGRHKAVPDGSAVLAELDRGLKECRKPRGWPSNDCVPAGCVRLCGGRYLRSAPAVALATAAADGVAVADLCLKRLCVGDGVWLHYMDLMGLPQILGVILDDYATKGRFPIFSDSREGIVIETMIGLIKSGGSSSVKERWTLYERGYGLKGDPARRLGLAVNENAAFLTNFNSLIREASSYYKYNRLGDAIQAVNDPGRPSVATLSAIRDIIGLLRKSFDSFGYGLNYSSTLDGIVWIVATLGLVRNLRKQLGIPESFDQPHEFIPAAYELLVTGKPMTPGETNRYTLHLDLARYARRILLDLEVLPLESAELSEVETWLALREEDVEGFRAANRTLTGIDLAGAGDRPNLPAREFA